MSKIKATKSKKKPLNMSLENCNDDRDPISMTIFWTETNGVRTIVYPKENIKDLVFYKDMKDRIMCLEKESLIYLKSYNIKSHPVTMEPFPENIFDNINSINMNQVIEDKSLKEIALDVFQYFSNISIFIDYNWFLKLNRNLLIKFNYEVRDFWLQNFTPEQRSSVSNTVFSKHESDFVSYTIEEIQLYLLNQMKILLTTEKEDLKYMINYILVGALGIVIPDIKELYPDFDLAF